MTATAGSTKLYKNLVNEVALTLQLIFTGNRYADKAVEKTLRAHPQWGSRDRRFIAEAVYDVVRNYRLYATLVGNDRNYWLMTAVWLVCKGHELPDWQEFRHVDAGAILGVKETLEKDPRLKFSYPDWLWDLMGEELGEERRLQEATAMHSQAEVYLRVNTLKTTKEKLVAGMQTERNAIYAVPGVASALRLQKRENVFQHRLFKEGWFEVQDAGSQIIGEFLNPLPGQVVIDACAGAGGKSLHIAALMKNKGRIISMDVEERKLEELRARARRAGVHTIQPRLITSENDITALKDSADRLLLDVPCSGLGVLKRNPDAKWKLTADTISRTRAIQADILSRYCVMVKPGGWMVYSTCSVLPSENEKQVAAFLEQHPGYRLEDEQMLWPSAGFDGFYMAGIRRKN
jgi:16S rRNA (cytosine967-C5)-methyltransferase